MKAQESSPNSAHRFGPRRIIASALGLVLLAALGLSAEAGDNRKPKEETRSIYLVKYHVHGEVRYKRPGKTVTVTESHYRSANAFVCTPSGFGRKARCYVPAR